MSNTVNNYTETDLGNISLNPRGEYDNSAAYEYLDTVSYRGGSYFCRAELETTITGIAPDSGHNSEHWQMIAAPGDMTPEYTAAYNDVINKAAQVEISRAAVELAQQEIEADQTDVQQLHSDTVQMAQQAENSKNSAANSAQSAEQSRKTVSESEQNINGQIAGFDSRVSEAVEQAKEEINTTKQQVINTITNQQTASVNTVKTEGEKIITGVGNDAKTVADDRATVEEATQTVLNNAQEVARNTQTVASNAEKAAASAEGAKTSADNAAQSAKSVEDASKQIEQNKKDVASLKGSVSTKITKFYKSNQGETHITDSDNGKIMDMMIYGKSSQDGTPTPENPVEIKSVVNPIVKVTNEDGLKVQSVTLNNITLNAIPVKSGGNVTIDGQQYIADYVDVEHGKVIRNILKWRLGDLKYGFNNAVWHMNISGLGIDGSKIGLSNMFKIQNGHYNGVTTSELYIAYDGKTAALNMRGMTDEEFKKWLREKNPEVYNVLTVAEEIPITLEEVSAFKQLMTYYPVTNVSVNSEQLDGYTVFNYPIPFEDTWNKAQKEIGGLKEETSSLKEDLDNVKKTTICKNIFGGVPNVYYPCNIPSGTDVTVSTEDGSNFEVGTTFNLYSSDKTRKDYWNLGNQSNRTIKTNADISYVTLSKAANANVQIEIGNKSTKYQDYFLDVKMLNKKLDNIGEDDIVNALINRAKIICGHVEKNTINGFLNNSDGSIKLDNTASQVTGFVKVIPNEILLYSGKGSTNVANVCFYDKKFAFISSVNSLEYGTFEINVPSEAVYARFASRASEDGEIAELIVNIKTKPMYKNNLTGKKWYACGDSFTEGAYIFNDLKLVDRWLEDGKYAGKLKSYPYYIGNRTNCDIYNIALSGSTLAYVSSEPKKYSFSSDYGTEEPSYNNYKSVPIDADYITLWFGINDNGYGVPIGNDDDTTNTTFKGAYNIVLKYFVENCKKAKIGIIVSNNLPQAYVDATIKMANRWGIKYLDLNSDEVPLMQATLRNVCDEAKANAINKFAISQSNMHPNYYAHEFESKFIEHWLLSL